MDKQIELKIKDLTSQIFNGINEKKLSDYEKRQIIFSYLCDNVKYDYDLLDKIYQNQVYKTKIRRDLIGELKSAIFDNLGICNSISQMYKLILDNVGIKAYCVICDDGTPVNHQMSMVYDKNKDVYSFDDVTSVIVGRGSKEEFFDYDIDFAKLKGQGNKKVLNDDEFVVLPYDYVDFLIGRTSKILKNIEKIPSNFASVKNSSTPSSLGE